MIKLLNANPIKPHVLELSFSDHTQGVFDGAAYLSTRQPEFDTNRAKCLICIDRVRASATTAASIGCVWCREWVS